MLEDMKLYELFVKEDVGKQVTFEDLQKWAKAKQDALDKIHVPGKDAIIIYATISSFLRENFLLDEEHNVITKPS